ncbi:uncharacterized protein LOC118181886 [Stegodyphus dumicola]|uniref:uncharacterized protein LOC118181886 n=1 Tax=Stegodyphus dumicola TaxID=202533 RepID=UPI0015A78C18|nr:uncharacterized protein LOC118181886 [Stegodyphus dumicola]
MYKHFMKEYLDLGHMEPVRSSESPSQAYYMPHHAVIKESSSTSKIRVVFNATSKSSSGLSLNDILMTGPRIQQELFPVLVKFRCYPVVVTADIMKMFRQILVNEEDRNFQRIFWRDRPSDPIQEFRLNTVTYGTASAPYLATRALYQLAYDEQNNYPLASKAVLQNFFVDDCLVGCSNTEECKNLVNQLLQMLERGGFLLRKWSSNDLSVLENIPQELRNDSEAMKIQDDSSIKVLGINWNPREDYFNFSVSISEMWKLHLSWDEPVSYEIANKWKTFQNDLHLIQQLKIPRFVLIPDVNYIDICAFCDASEKGYCAAIYLRSVSRNLDIKVTLLTSKTRVAPLKVQSLPRLELCAAVLLVNLLKSVLEHLEFPIRKVLAWTDSTVVLSWIFAEPYRWVPFVANRVAKIQNTIPNVRWNHINGKRNPADSGTRGMFPAEFLKCERWFIGPTWLYSQDFEPCPDSEHLSDVDYEGVQIEARPTQIMGDLPSPRVQPSRPFAVTGVDYAGPYSIKSQVGRRTKTFKCYISIFVCFSTKAVHLELVSDLSTSTFLAALK